MVDPEVGSGAASDMWVLKNGKECSKGTCAMEELGVKATDDYTLEVETSY